MKQLAVHIGIACLLITASFLSGLQVTRWPEMTMWMASFSLATGILSIVTGLGTVIAWTEGYYDRCSPSPPA